MQHLSKVQYGTIWYDIFNCNWVTTRWQYYSTQAVAQYTFAHKQYIEQHNRHKQYIEQNISLIRKIADRAPSLRYSLAFALQLRKKHGKPSVRVAGECQLAKSIQYSSTVSLTSALDGGWWLTPIPGCFTSPNDPVPIVQKAGSSPGPSRTGVENLGTGLAVIYTWCRCF